MTFNNQLNTKCNQSLLKKIVESDLVIGMVLIHIQLSGKKLIENLLIHAPIYVERCR